MGSESVSNETCEDRSNEMDEWTLNTICAGPVGNKRGGFHALNLRTGRKITRHQATPISAPKQITSHAHKPAWKEKMERRLVITNKNGSQSVDNKTGTISSSESLSTNDENDNTDGATLDSGHLSCGSTDTSSTHPTSWDSSFDNDDNNNNRWTTSQRSVMDSKSSLVKSTNNQNCREAVGNSSNHSWSRQEPDNNTGRSTRPSTDEQAAESREKEEVEEPTGDKPATESGEREEVDETGVDNTWERWAATHTHPLTGKQNVVHTRRGWDNAMTVLDHVEEIQKLTSRHANATGLITCVECDQDDHQGFHTCVSHVPLTQHRINQGLKLFEEEGGSGQS